MNCHICGSKDILMREHPIENNLPVYHTSIFYKGEKTKEIDIIFCSAKCSLEFHENVKAQNITDNE